MVSFSIFISLRILFQKQATDAGRIQMEKPLVKIAQIVFGEGQYVYINSRTTLQGKVASQEKNICASLFILT